MSKLIHVKSAPDGKRLSQLIANQGELSRVLLTCDRAGRVTIASSHVSATRGEATGAAPTTGATKENDGYAFRGRRAVARAKR